MSIIFDTSGFWAYSMIGEYEAHFYGPKLSKIMQFGADADIHMDKSKMDINCHSISSNNFMNMMLNS